MQLLTLAAEHEQVNKGLKTCELHPVNRFISYIDNSVHNKNNTHIELLQSLKEKVLKLRVSLGETEKTLILVKTIDNVHSLQ